MWTVEWLILAILFPIQTQARHKRPHRQHRGCVEPPQLKEELASWMRESLEGAVGEVVEEDWMPPTIEPPICHRSPKAEGETSVMQRALCPWESQVNYDETREPKIISEARCLCRRSRGTSGAFCMPIKREIPVLRRLECNPDVGYWEYIRSTQKVIVGCHSVLPRTQRATSLSKHYKKANLEQI